MMTQTPRLLALLTLAATTSIAQTAEAQDSAPRGYVALGASILPEYEGADVAQAIPLIAGRAQLGRRYVAVEGVSARANLLTSPSWELGPLASVVFGRDRDIESARVARLRPLDEAIEIGSFVARTWTDVGIEGGETRLELRAVGDVSDVYGGWQSTVSAGYAAPLGARWRLGGEVSTTLSSDDYADTYFSSVPWTQWPAACRDSAPGAASRTSASLRTSRSQ